MAGRSKKVVLDSDEYPWKILFLGDDGIGKTTFIENYCEHMPFSYRCDTYRGNDLVFTQFLLYFEKFGFRIPFRLLDLPAGTTKESRRDQYPPQVNLIVLCYAFDNTTSFENVTNKWFPEFRRCCSKSTRFYLLGLKNEKRRELLKEGKVTIEEKLVRRVHRTYGFKGDDLDCSVEENSKEARVTMEKLINDAIRYDPRDDLPYLCVEDSELLLKIFRSEFF